MCRSKMSHGVHHRCRLGPVNTGATPAAPVRHDCADQACQTLSATAPAGTAPVHVGPRIAQASLEAFAGRRGEREAVPCTVTTRHTRATTHHAAQGLVIAVDLEGPADHVQDLVVPD